MFNEKNYKYVFETKKNGNIMINVQCTRKL